MGDRSIGQHFFSSCPVLPCLVSMSHFPRPPPPPGDFLASKKAAWENPDCTKGQDVWFSGKEGWEIEPDTWQGPQAGRHAGKAGLYSTSGLSRPAPRLGSWQRPEQASTGGRLPVGNGKAQRLVMAALTGFCVLVFRTRERCVSSCQSLCGSNASTRTHAWTLLEHSSCHYLCSQCRRDTETPWAMVSPLNPTAYSW